MYEVVGSVASRAFRVLWALEELGQPYLLREAKPHSDAARAANPSGKIPALLTEADALSDSTAILTYLADHHGALTAPAGTLDRARQDALTHAILDELDSVLWTAAKHSFILPVEERVEEVKPTLRREYARNLHGIAARIKGPFVTGSEMTIPDILLTHCCNWAISAKFPESPAAMQPYLKTMRARPAFRAARAAGSS